MEKDSSNISEKIKSVLTTEVKFIIVVLSFGLGVVAPYYQMKEDIALIKKDISTINANHEVHIQDIMQSLKDIQEDQTVQNDKIITLQESVIRLSK